MSFQPIIKSAHRSFSPQGEDGLLHSSLITVPQSQATIFALTKILGKRTKKRENLESAVHQELIQLRDSVDEHTNIPRRFEQLLQSVNHRVDKIAKEGPQVPLSDFHAIIGVIHKRQVFISGIGSLHALFLHKTAKQRYVIYELDAHLKEQEEQTWEKPFITVLDGELHPGDIFYIATRVSPRELTIAQLQDILVTLPPSGAIEKIHQHLRPQTLYSGLCFNVSQEQPSGRPKKVNPLSSVEQLNQAHEETKTLLGEQRPDLATTLNKLTQPILKELSVNGHQDAWSILKRLLALSVRFLTAFIIVLSRVFHVVGRSLWRLLKHSPTVYAFVKKTFTKSPTPQERFFQFFTSVQRWPKAKKIGWSIGFAAIIILLLGTTVLHHTSQNRQQDTFFNTLVEQVEEKTNAAEASLIYDDQTQAQTFITEALALLETIPQRTTEQERRVAELQRSIQTVILEIQGITPVEVTTIPANTTLHTLVRIADTTYLLDTASNLYRFDSLTQSIVPVDATTGAIGTILRMSNQGDTTVFLDNEQRIGVFDQTTSTLNPVVSGAEALASAEDLTLYNDTLYVLTAKGEQIIKMRKQGDGFEAGTPWITGSTATLEQARALTIDGDVYVLLEDDVLKYRSGRQQTFSLATITPALSNATDLWTTTDSAYLYLLDNSDEQTRVIVTTKEGSLVTQYTLTDIRDATAFFVDESTNSITVLTQSGMHTFTANHLLQ